MSDNKIRFVIIGFGHIGRRHADMVMNHEGCELVAVVDTNPELKESVQSICNVPYFSSWDEFIASSIKADVANVATPNGLHAVNAIAAAESGCHVVVEKPLALTTKDCQAILDTVDKNERQVFCVMQNRYSAPMQWLKKMLTENMLGNIFMINVQCYWNRDERYYTGDTWKGTDELDGGTLFTQFSHYVDLLYWLFGDLKDITAHFANFNHNGIINFEDSAVVNFNTEHGACGSFSYTTSVWDKNMESTMVIVGEKGTIKIGGQYMDKVEYCHVQDYILNEQEVKSILPVNGYADAKANHFYVIDNVVNVLKHKLPITTTGEEGAKIVEIIEQIYSLKKQHA